MTRLLALLLFSGIGNAQNLVQNPSFEQRSSCPNAPEQITFCTHWDRPPNTTGSPDYYNACSPVNMDVPSNINGFQFAKDGTAYVGIATYGGPNFREYIETQLSSPMEAGQTYQVSFYVSLSDICKFASNNIGAVFTADPVAGNGTQNPIILLPSVMSTDVIASKTAWTGISGTYTAVGGEKYMTIGNFFNEDDTYGEMLYPDAATLYAYYFIDHITVSPSLGLDDIQEEKIKVYPNPVTDSFSLRSTRNNTISEIVLYSHYQVIKRFKIEESVFDMAGLPAGVYYVAITFSSGERGVAKIIKI